MTSKNRSNPNNPSELQRLRQENARLRGVADQVEARDREWLTGFCRTYFADLATEANIAWATTRAREWSRTIPCDADGLLTCSGYCCEENPRRFTTRAALEGHLIGLAFATLDVANDLPTPDTKKR